MYLATNMVNTNTRAMVDTWRGYNHNPRISAGEFYDMENLTSDSYPLMAPRKKRAKLIEENNIRGILLTDDRLCYLTGNTLYYGSRTYDISDYLNGYTETDDEQQLIRFGAYILIYPVMVYINLATDEVGNFVSSFESAAGITITYSMCDANGAAFSNITASATAPTNPTDGQYWLNTTAGEQGLNIWVASLSMWQPVATTYVNIHIPGGTLTDYFAEGDTVMLNTVYSDINNGSTIQRLDNENLVVIGILPVVSATARTDNIWKLNVSRKIPDMQYICASGNRLWGCFYGNDGNGSIVNEIYASKLGDFKNWYSFDGTAADAYAASIGEEGYWTGCISYQGKPVFFKENSVIRVYGSYPAEFQIIVNNVRGVQNGSYKSLAILNEYLVYKSASDVVVYDGSNPTSISKELGRDKVYYDAVAGATLGKYYLSMQDVRGHVYNFVYDMEHNLWMKEDSDIKIKQFTASESGQIYANTDTEIYGLGANENVLFVNKLPGEEYVSWWAETGDIGIEYPDYKRITKIQLRALIPSKSEIQVWISFDDKAYEEKAVFRGNGELTTHTIMIQGLRCDHYRIKFIGHGDCSIYSMTSTLDADGGDYG